MRYSKTNPWKWSEKQKSVIINVSHDILHNNSDNLYYMLSGGVGAGKSLVGLYLVDFICRRQPGITALVSRRVYSALLTDTFNILKNNPAILDDSKGKWNNLERTFKYTNGSIIYFRQLENADDYLLGPSYGLIYVDQIELCKEDDYRLLTTRLRQFGKNHYYNSEFKSQIANHQVLRPHNYMILTANPKGCWVKKNIIYNCESNFKIFNFPTICNAENLPEGYINENESQSFKDRYYGGIWDNLKGLIYPEFTDKNLVTNNYHEKYIYKEQISGKIITDFSKLTNYIIIDPGFITSKYAVLFASIMPDGSMYFYDSLSYNGKKVDEQNRVYIDTICREIKSKIAEYNIYNYNGLIDPAANAASEGGPSRTQQLQESGIYVSNAQKTNEIAGIMRVNKEMKAGKIKINANCVQLLQELEIYSWKTNKVGNIDKEVPEDRDNDFCDAMLYLSNELASPTHHAINITYTQDEIIKKAYAELLGPPLFPPEEAEKDEFDMTKYN